MEEEYVIGFPPEMNNKNNRMSLDENTKFMTLPLQGEFAKKRGKKKDNSEMTH